MLINSPSDVPSGSTENDAPEDVRRHHLAVLDWSMLAIQEGESFLRSQPGYNDIDNTISTIMGEPTDAMRPSSLSSLNVNQFGKIALDLKSAECDIKPFWDYKVSNKRFEQQAQLAQKLAKSWYVRRQIGMRFNDGLSYANAAGTTYFHNIWDTRIMDQDSPAIDPRDLLPVRPGSFRSIQEAFAAMLRQAQSVNFVKASYPEAARYIKPDRDGSLAAQKANNRVQKLLETLNQTSGFIDNLFGSLGIRPKSNPGLNCPEVDKYTLYVDDPATNKTQHIIPMGYIKGNDNKLQRTNWSYDVAPGERLYPRKRCIVFCRSAVLYDGPSIYWHGLYPFPKLTIDPWPWSWLGKAPMRDLLPLHAELQKMVRGVSQHWDRVFRPGLAADKNSMSRSAIDRIATARAGIKIRHNPLAGKGVEMLYEPPLDAAWQQWIQLIVEQMKDLSGVKDISQMMNLGQIPSTETVEKILETMSPSIRLRSQVMEAFISEYAMIVLNNFFQFYTAPMRLSVLGPSGLTFEDEDFDPGTLIPDTLALWPNRDPLQPEATRAERAQEFSRLFAYDVAPGSLLASAGVTEKLLYMQLAKAGILDSITLLEKLGIPNIMPASAMEEAGNTIMQRLTWLQQQGFDVAANSAGRKQTNQTMPRQVTKTS
jgi:hypothetical protein